MSPGQLGVNRTHIEDNNVEFFKNHLANSLLTFVYIFINERDMEFVKKFTLSDFQAKYFTPSISPNFNSFSREKKHKK